MPFLHDASDAHGLGAAGVVGEVGLVGHVVANAVAIKPAVPVLRRRLAAPARGLVQALLKRASIRGHGTSLKSGSDEGESRMRAAAASKREREG
eukprot:CAMPEP_0174915866 /NCGR_PEP_ID=MMETSP1355-20121228/1424_1 /TAXON_ID=464990 /ORGANISM="Hemiselmis tepida, Strain CCMP443" /LENGTH=93 /DNA_ID=CAMNT_0016160813 /DNA_START=90 /DNA_END=367 /DNA_ORIENTATION=+